MFSQWGCQKFSRLFDPEYEAPQSFTASGTTNPVTQRHIPEDFNLLHSPRILKEKVKLSRYRPGGVA
jgi:hypothetical protein